MSRSARLIAVALLLASCAPPRDNDEDGDRQEADGGTTPGEAAGCTPSACDTLTSVFKHVLQYDIAFDDCLWRVGNTNDKPDDLDARVMCPKVCEATGSGAVLACVERRKGECEDPTVPYSERPRRCRTIAQECADENAAQQPVLDRTCVNSCLEERVTCESSCEMSSFMSCWNCSRACTEAHVTCLQACPLATAACSDRVKGANESDVDCGGPCGPCAPGKACSTDADCARTACVDGNCAEQEICNHGENDCEDAAQYCFGRACYSK